MSESKDQAEPTMEEILASIRRIISEDDPGIDEAHGATPDDAAEDETPQESPAELAADEPAADEPAADEPAAEEPVGEPDAGDLAPEAAPDEDVLDLTQKVNPDGTVIDLAAVRDEAAEPEPEAELAVEPQPEPEPVPEPEAAPAAHAFAAAEESILATETQSATAGSLSEIARAAAVRQMHGVQVGDGRTLEEIVREALTPELKAWLDSHLAPLVEQIVREEIKKMVRRAEDM